MDDEHFLKFLDPDYLRQMIARLPELEGALPGMVGAAASVRAMEAAKAKAEVTFREHEAAEKWESQGLGKEEDLEAIVDRFGEFGTEHMWHVAGCEYVWEIASTFLRVFYADVKPDVFEKLAKLVIDEHSANVYDEKLKRYESKDWITYDLAKEQFQAYVRQRLEPRVRAACLKRWQERSAATAPDHAGAQAQAAAAEDSNASREPSPSEPASRPSGKSQAPPEDDERSKTSNRHEAKSTKHRRFPKGSMDRVAQMDPVWRIGESATGPIRVKRLSGEVVSIDPSAANEPDDAVLAPEDKQRITEVTLSGRSELRKEISTVFGGPTWPQPSAMLEPFRRYATKIFDVNAAAYRSAVSKQEKETHAALRAMMHNLLLGVFGSEWENSPGEEVVRTYWEHGVDGWMGTEVVVLAGDDPDPNCLYHELVGDAVQYRYRFHDVPPAPIPGEPPAINLSNVDWLQYIGLTERHNLAMAIKPYLEDRVAHWESIYAASETKPAKPHATDASDPAKPKRHSVRPNVAAADVNHLGSVGGQGDSAQSKSEYRAGLKKLKSLALLGWRYRRRSIVPSVSALRRLYVDAMDLLLRIGPTVSKVREEVDGLRLANYASQREDWREAHIYPAAIRRFTKLLIAAHRLLERERPSHVETTNRAKPVEHAPADQGSEEGNTAAAHGNSDPRGKARKGDAALLQGKRSVSFATAEEYLGISERQRQKLMNSGALTVEGQGQNRKITTESLKKYLPPEIPN